MAKERTITFIVTKDCQLVCKYCYLVGKNPNEKMTLDVAKKAVDKILENSYFFNEERVVWDFIGGEPLLEIDLITNIVDYIEMRLEALSHHWKNNYGIRITTNGLLYKSQKVQNFISKYQNILNLSISIDGTKRKQDLNRVFPNENLIVKDEVGYGITELGAILFAKRLSDFDGLKRKMVRVIVYKGKNKIDTIREQSFDKGYAIGFKEMVAWINSQLPANEEIGLALRKDTRMYPEIAIRELSANMIIHQDFSEQGFPMIEIYSDRISFSNPGQPLISVERFIDEYQSRNDSLADIMRRIGICEEKGSGMDKAIFSIELYQLPPIRIQLQETRTETTIFAYRKFANLDKSERVMACYQHACLRYVSNEKMNNQSLRGRLGIEDKNYPMASRIIKDALEAKMIKEENADGNKRHNYVPYWA